MEQSPLSHSIRNLESELGIKLFQRTTRKTWLTRAGVRFYREVRRILHDIELATAIAQRSSEDEPIIVRLALGEDLASEPFTRLLFELEHHNPTLELEVRELLHTEAARLVRDGGADVAITLNPRAEAELKQVRAWSEPLMAVVPIGHVLAERDKISIRELAIETLALPFESECPGYLAQIGALMDRYGIRPAGRRSVRHWNTAVSFAATGHAIALCPITMVHTTASVAVVALEEQDADLATYLLYREERSEASSAVSLVLAIVAEITADGRELAAANGNG